MNRVLLLVISIFVFSVTHSFGQTNISGVINTYTTVSSTSTGCTDPCDPLCNSTIAVASTAGFAVNDRILIIQMKGATVDVSNTAAHGSITNLNDAGNYEFATISAISGNNITTTLPLKESYFSNTTPTDSACVQLIRVPVYSDNVNVSGTLTAQAWNGRTGGVLAFETDGTLNLSANISVNGLGFQAARRQQTTLACGKDTAFYYQSTIWQHSACTSCGYHYDDPSLRLVSAASYGGCGSNCFTNRMVSGDRHLGAYRGEGIAANTFTKVFNNGNIAVFDKGKGRWGTGGGGGGNHNGGGGGGSNFGSGGFGGNAFNSTACPAGTHGARRGYGGDTLGFSGSRIFLGGGGGEGHDNGGNGSTGTNGGGIIFITAAEVTTSGSYSITANGIDNTVLASGDGSGGGGAGGSILMQVEGSIANAINISARGGNGGNHGNPNCHGTGGGGGGGVVAFSGNAAPEGATAEGGVNGIQTAASPDCGSTTWGATAGGAGAIITNNPFNINICGFILPVKMGNFTAVNNDDKVILDWTTREEMNSKEFIIQRSTDGYKFSNIGTLKSSNQSNSSYSFIDNNLPQHVGTLYYRLQQVDLNGKSEIFGPLQVKLPLHFAGIIAITPNPVNTMQDLNLKYNSYSQNNVEVTIISLLGNIVFQQEFNSEKGYNDFRINTDEIVPGTYIIQVKQQEKSSVQKIIVK